MMFEKHKKDIKNRSVINPFVLLQNFYNSQRAKRKDYAELLTENSGLRFLEDARKMEEDIRVQIKADFPEISGKSLELLVDATMHHIRKKQLKATDDICFK